MPRKTALKEFKYGSKLRFVGDTFNVADKDVRILTAIGKIGDAKSSAKVETEAVLVEQEADAKPAKGKYKTKDMKAEG